MENTTREEEDKTLGIMPGDAAADPVPAADLVPDAEEGGVLLVKRTDSEYVESIYQAVQVACSCSGSHSMQLPGRDKILQVMRTNSELVGKKESGFTRWKNALDFLKLTGLVYTVPNSGTFVTKEGGTIGNILNLLQDGIRVENEAVQADVRKIIQGISISRSSSSSSGSIIAEEPEDSDAKGSSEEEIAAEILQDLKFTKEPAGMALVAAKQRGGAGARKSARQPKKKRGGQGPSSSFDPSTVGFKLNGPWEPKNEDEEEEYTAFLTMLVNGNTNVTSWTHARLKKSVAAIFGVLHAAPRGLTRIQLRNAARAYVGDTGLLDYTIKVLVNLQLCGFFMNRTTDPVNGKLFYTVDYIADNEGKKPSFQAAAISPLPGHEDANAQTNENVPPAEASEGEDPNTPVLHGRRAGGKRKAPAPMRYEDYYNSTAGSGRKDKTAVVAKPPVKRSRYFKAVQNKNVQNSEATNPIPPKLEGSFAWRQQRVNDAQENMIVGGNQDISTAAEVNNIVYEAASQAQGANMQTNWMKQYLTNEILKEITGAQQDVHQLREEFNKVIFTCLG
ncbi:hypothetical protein HOP50_15g74550 [Chloropicon primus]|uniref:PTC1-like winged helix-turn-helix domain-containing protein n=1 Tax=Chloropicon primus TaxID=1764295 RepID=A0A5B8MZ71_9CHLO|nr:hypothetical protein A3770_15p74300 [Chloropicon primus]UPR04121.1 hypothetical protein HOP50_15g74550 [Chloropicon primus]|mmetsp:Transcript_5067/g.15195  ORF Transcript_5067/g.15195 Transcript_5067/m.15195 type:complete len:561 (+) Transcript_5067:435-2117(+)|eukprot:QDZ24912.1 hypothetical protein A3770_15p74300 [Chloropicon primus]